MSYIPGNRFRVSATREADGSLSMPRIYSKRFRFRAPTDAPTALLQDEELVEVLAYLDGAVIVIAHRTSEVGWLG